MLANFTAEQKLIKNLVETDQYPNILFLQGDSGSGKSALLRHCLNNNGRVPHQLLDLKSGANTNTIATLFDLVGANVGWDHFPAFVETVTSMLPSHTATAGDSWLLGMRLHIQELTRIADLESRLSIYRPLTLSWFADMNRLETPFLLAIDTYNDASAEFQQWLENEFLYLAARSPTVRIVICGQTLPSEQGAWSESTTTTTLDGVQDPQDWLKWAKSIGRLVPDESYLTGVIDALQGQPLTIANFIQSTMPAAKEKEAGDQVATEKVPAALPAVKRRLYRKNLIDYFSLTAIKTLCFDLEINYERLPGDGSLDSAVLELLSYLNRQPELLIDFVAICRDERPDLDW